MLISRFNLFKEVKERKSLGVLWPIRGVLLCLYLEITCLLYKVKQLTATSCIVRLSRVADIL